MESMEENPVYRKIYDLILKTGNAKDPKNLVIQFLIALQEYCSYDAAVVYYVDHNGKFCGQYLINTTEKTSAVYLEYYRYLDDGRYNAYPNDYQRTGTEGLFIHDWKQETDRDFVKDFIRPRRLSYSLGFNLKDLYGRVRTIIALDWTGDHRYREEEAELLRLIIPVLDQLHRSFFFQGIKENAVRWAAEGVARLTDRESEIANLLCQGVSPANISKSLCISRSTAYRHIANIYEKLHVSNRQELMVLLLNTRDYHGE